MNTVNGTEAREKQLASGTRGMLEHRSPSKTTGMVLTEAGEIQAKEIQTEWLSPALGEGLWWKSVAEPGVFSRHHFHPSVLPTISSPFQSLPERPK